MRKVRTPEPELFPEFWAVWLPIARHTDGRGLARETFRKHILNGAEPQDIVDGAKWFARSLTDRDRPYVPMSATWLNRCSYEDLCHKERAYQARLAGMEQSANVVSMKPAPRPANHFLSKLERGEVTLASGE